MHGWAHFRRCHTTVIDLVYGMGRLGLNVRISDEGDYWPGRDLAALRRNVDEMNGLVAAAAGTMKDLDAAKGRPSQVQSPIFAHPQFEHLEAEGARRVGPALQRLRKAIESDGPQP